MTYKFVRPTFSTQYEDFGASSNLHALTCSDPSLALQSEKDEADINTIVKRFGLAGELPQGVRAPVYGDFTGVSDYREALHAVQAADVAFMALPANVRSRFDNDPAAFVDFCSDPANRDEAQELGLLVPVDASKAAADGSGASKDAGLASSDKGVSKPA